jgi:hypothetical protein
MSRPFFHGNNLISDEVWIKDYPPPSGLWESGNPRILRISKRGGKVLLLDFSTERLFHSPLGAALLQLHAP